MDRLPGREQQWVQRIRAGDEAAFQALFQAYYPRLCRFAMGYVKSHDRAHDVVQEVFIKLWTGRGQWVLRGSLKTYLYQAVRNQALNHLRGEQRRAAYEHEQVTEAAKAARTAEDEYQLKELTKAIWEAIDQLPERRRTAFVLHRQHGLTYKEVAQVMGTRPTTVHTQIGKALRFLKETLPPEYF